MSSTVSVSQRASEKTSNQRFLASSLRSRSLRADERWKHHSGIQSQQTSTSSLSQDRSLQMLRCWHGKRWKDLSPQTAQTFFDAPPGDNAAVTGCYWFLPLIEKNWGIEKEGIKDLKVTKLNWKQYALGALPTSWFHHTGWISDEFLFSHFVCQSETRWH